MHGDLVRTVWSVRCARWRWRSSFLFGSVRSCVASIYLSHVFTRLRQRGVGRHRIDGGWGVRAVESARRPCFQSCSEAPFGSA